MARRLGQGYKAKLGFRIFDDELRMAVQLMAVVKRSPPKPWLYSFLLCLLWTWARDDLESLFRLNTVKAVSQGVVGRP